MFVNSYASCKGKKRKKTCIPNIQSTGSETTYFYFEEYFWKKNNDDG